MKKKVSNEEKELLSRAFSILGSRTSKKKKASSKKNGMLGGRPKKSGK